MVAPIVAPVVALIGGLMGVVTGRLVADARPFSVPPTDNLVPGASCWTLSVDVMVDMVPPRAATAAPPTHAHTCIPRATAII